MSKPDTHVVLVRPVATNKWKPLAYAKSAEAAIISAQKQRKSLRHGDLILAIDIAHVSAIQELGQCLYFVNKSGVVTKAPFAPNKPTWFLEWEGPGANAYDMLESCGLVDDSITAATAFALARESLADVPAGENRPIAALEMAEAWVAGKATRVQAEMARDVAWSAMSNAGTNSISVYYAISSVLDPTYTVANVAFRTASSMAGNHGDNLLRLSHLVRKYIPLHIVLESLALAS